MIAAYVRVSSPKRNGQSRQDTASQRSRITEWLSAHGYATDGVTWYEDYATGRNVRRSGLDALLTACRAGQAKQIVATDLSRISRSVSDAVALVRGLHTEGVSLHLVNQGFTFEANALNSAMLQIMAVLAELESSTKSERIKAGLSVARGNGQRLGRPKGSANRDRVQRLRQDGVSVKEIAAKLGLSRAGVYFLLAS